MDGILICTALLIAIALLRLRGQESDALAYAPVRVNADENISTSAIIGGGLMVHESPFLSSSDDDWTSSSSNDEGSISSGYDSDTSLDTDWTTDPAYAYLLGNIYHDTLYGDSFSSSSDDDWSSSATSFDDSFSSSSSDDSWSDSNFDDSFSSSISFND